MRTRIEFNAWGYGPFDSPSYALVEHDELDIVDAVVRAIERKSRLSVCAGPRPEGTDLETGAAHYAMTLGKPLSSGGYSPEAEVWISLPPDQGSAEWWEQRRAFLNWIAA